jgi:hypothetical protein
VINPMPKKLKKDKRPRSPKPNSQIPLSRIRPMKILGPRYYLQHAREYPILGCWVMAGWKKEGITPVIVVRQQEPGKVIFAVCMVDLFCLGVKNAYANADFPQAKFMRELPHMCIDAPEPCSIELAHEIIYGGLEYAERYGFQPHRDFTAQWCDQVLDPPEMHARTNHVKFGQKGKPFFISGPDDDDHKIKSVLDTLMRTAGEGNFDFVAGFDPTDLFDE